MINADPKIQRNLIKPAGESSVDIDSMFNLSEC
jgi:hypothetical protein